MHYLFVGFGLGFLIPFIARRFGKILPDTMGAILFHMFHRPHFPKIHNPLQTQLLHKYWKKLLLHALIYAFLTTGLFYLAHVYLPAKAFIFACFFIWIILCAADTDMRYFLLPDCLTIPLLLIGILYACQTNMLSPSQSIQGALFSLLITTLSVFVFEFKQQTVFGAGDSKMAIALGAWLGIQGLAYCVLASFFLFVLYSLTTQKRDGAYGPALGLAALFVFFLLYAK